MFNISASDYINIFYWAFSVPIIWIFITRVGVMGNSYLLEKQSQMPMLCLTIFLILFIGFRPSSGVFCDMKAYEYGYSLVEVTDVTANWSREWIWQWLMVVCKGAGLLPTQWFAIIELVYLGCLFWACKKLLHENVTVAMLFFLSSYSFFSYGVNTIRNGMACSIVVVAMAFWLEGKAKWWVAALLFFVALGVHRSTIIPIVALFSSQFLIKTPKTAIYIWLISIVLSLIAGSTLMNLFSGIEFDNRFEKYARIDTATQKLAISGFRWDFLLYSTMPVLLAWYVSEVKKIKDPVFNLIANTYILANSVWVICIRAGYSDRFAHLSWFLYPLVFAYALVRVPIFKNQDSVMAWVLFVYAGFTLFMSLVLGK